MDQDCTCEVHDCERHKSATIPARLRCWEDENQGHFTQKAERSFGDKEREIRIASALTRENIVARENTVGWQVTEKVR
jgi:hypothetical protein